MNQRQSNAVLIFLGFCLCFFTGYPILTGGYPNGGKLFDIITMVLSSALISIIYYLIADNKPRLEPTQKIIEYLPTEEGRTALAWALLVMGSIIAFIGVICFTSIAFPTTINAGPFGQLGVGLISFGFALTVYSANIDNIIKSERNNTKLVITLESIKNEINKLK